MTSADVVSVVTAIVGVVGPEVARAILEHGAASPAVPTDARAAVHAILYPGGARELASETEHAIDVAELARVRVGSEP